MKKLILNLLFVFLLIPTFAQITPDTVACTYRFDDPNPLMIDALINDHLKTRGISPFTRKLIISHARTESGTYTNNLVIYHNNLFGMRHPSIRPTKSIGPFARAEGRGGYASYHDLLESVDDYLMYLEYIGELRSYKTTAGYVEMLRRHYYFGVDAKVYLKNMIFHNSKQLAYR